MPNSVAYLGPEATFSHQAARENFDPACHFVPQRTIPDIFRVVAQGEVEFGVVPVENSLEGAVTYTLDMFGRSDMEGVRICDELYLPIVQNLLTRAGANQNLADLKVVYSHPQALAQCHQWLQAHLPWAALQETTSTASAAQQVAQENGCAAIANRLAAEQYGLEILRPAIQDADFNQTRFLVITQQATPYSSLGPGRDVTALMFSIKDRVGRLHAITSVMLKYDLNLNRIESRPSKQRAWDYVFFIDFFGHPAEPTVRVALQELQSETVWVRVLGTWTRASSALKAEE